MASKKDKYLSSAQKYFQKGDYKKAIEEYKKALEEDPNDIRTLKKIGDLQVKLGDKDGAVETYLRVSEAYKDKGFLNKALAILKQIQMLAPERHDVYMKLADVYIASDLIPDALYQLDRLRLLQEQAGDTEGVLRTMEKMVDIDPTGYTQRINLAETLSRMGRRKEAADQFRKAAEVLWDKGERGMFIKVAERLLWHDPSDMWALRKLSEACIQEGCAKKVLKRLLQRYREEPTNLELLRLLAEVFSAAGKTDKALAVYVELMNILDKRGEKDGARQVAETILSMDPSHPEARRVAGLEQEEEEEEIIELSEEELEIIEEDEEGEPEGLEGEHLKIYEDALSFYLYDLYDKAEEKLAELPSELRSHPKVMELRKNLAVKQGRTEEAVELLRLLYLATKDQDPAKARQYADEALSLDPSLLWPLEEGTGSLDISMIEEDLEAIEGEEPAGEEELLLSLDMDEFRPSPTSEAYQLEEEALEDSEVQGIIHSIKSLSQQFEVPREVLEDDFGTDELEKFNETSQAIIELNKLGLEDTTPPPVSEGEDLLETSLGEGEDLVDVDELDIGLVEELDAPSEGKDVLDLEFGGMDADMDTEVEPQEDFTPTDSGVTEDIESIFDFEEKVERHILKEEAPPAEEEEAQSEPEAPKEEEGQEAAPSAEQEAEEEELPDKVRETLEELDFYLSMDLIEDAIFALEDTLKEIDHPALREKLRELRAMAGHEEPEGASQAEREEPQAEREEPQPAQESAGDVTKEPGNAEIQEEPADEALLERETQPIDEELIEEVVELDEADIVEEDITPVAEQELLENLIAESKEPEIYEDEDDLETLTTDVEPMPEVDVPLDGMGAQEGEDMLENFDLGDLEEELGEDLIEEALSSLQATEAQERFEASSSQEYDEHYDLGIAYKEMGLIDKALAEFQLSAENPSMRVPAGLMIGHCYRDKGMYSKATVEYKKLLHSEGLTTEQELEIFYALGETYEMMGDNDEALYYYERIAKKASDYRDVAERIKRLTQ